MAESEDWIVSPSGPVKVGVPYNEPDAPGGPRGLMGIVTVVWRHAMATKAGIRFCGRNMMGAKFAWLYLDSNHCEESHNR